MPPDRSTRRQGIAAPGVAVRGRRLRRTAALREWVAETVVEPRRMVLPVFVRPGTGAPEPIPSLPGVAWESVGSVPKLAEKLRDDRVPAVLLFGAAARKDPSGREASSPRSAVSLAVRAMKRAVPDLIVATDVCLCAYTSHGHCGVVADGEVDNDRSVERLGEIAVAHASSGADVVAPSAMMDGQVAGLRAALDGAGLSSTAILAYASKHASSLYGPFRAAEGSAPAFGDRAAYQMDPRNGREALAEMRRDAEEGADILMVKPALTSLDLLARARRRFDVPLAAYQVSGEYAMLKAGAARGAFDERAAVLETLTAIRRAGADLVVSYYAREVARWLRGSA